MYVKSNVSCSLVRDVDGYNVFEEAKTPFKLTWCERWFTVPIDDLLASEVVSEGFWAGVSDRCIPALVPDFTLEEVTESPVMTACCWVLSPSSAVVEKCVRFCWEYEDIRRWLWESGGLVEAVDAEDALEVLGGVFVEKVFTEEGAPIRSPDAPVPELSAACASCSTS